METPFQTSSQGCWPPLMSSTRDFCVHFKAPLETSGPTVPYKSVCIFGEDFRPAITHDLVLLQPGRMAGLPGANLAGLHGAGAELLRGDRLSVGEDKTALGTGGVRVAQQCGHASCQDREA